VYEVISAFCLLHPFLILYLAGSMIAIGIIYSLISNNLVDSSISNRKRYILSAVGSWIVVGVFLYGFLGGFLKNLIKGGQ